MDEKSMNWNYLSAEFVIMCRIVLRSNDQNRMAIVLCLSIVLCFKTENETMWANARESIVLGRTQIVAKLTMRIDFIVKKSIFLTEQTRSENWIRIKTESNRKWKWNRKEKKNNEKSNVWWLAFSHSHQTQCLVRFSSVSSLNLAHLLYSLDAMQVQKMFTPKLGISFGTGMKRRIYL